MAQSDHIDNDRGKEKASDLLLNKMVAISYRRRSALLLRARERSDGITREQVAFINVSRPSAPSPLRLMKKGICIISTINHAAVTAGMIHQLDGNGSGCARARARARSSRGIRTR